MIIANFKLPANERSVLHFQRLPISQRQWCPPLSFPSPRQRESRSWPGFFCDLCCFRLLIADNDAANYQLNDKTTVFFGCQEVFTANEHLPFLSQFVLDNKSKQKNQNEVLCCCPPRLCRLRRCLLRKLVSFIRICLNAFELSTRWPLSVRHMNLDSNCF